MKLVELYPMIFKRKSFHVFRTYMPLLKTDLDRIENLLKQLLPLIPGIRLKIELVRKEETSCMRGEYCILFYSEKKAGAFMNVGYIGAQLDLLLAYYNIGVCWYGAGKVKHINNGNLEFVIMLAIQKVEESEFRKDMFRSKRKELSEIWEGKHFLNIARIARFAPSACNIQPWFTISDKKQLDVYKLRHTKRGIMPKDKVDMYNEMGMGIFLCYLEICMKHECIIFSRKLYADDCYVSEEKQICATYMLET